MPFDDSCGVGFKEARFPGTSSVVSDAMLLALQVSGGLLECTWFDRVDVAGFMCIFLWFLDSRSSSGWVWRIYDRRGSKMI